MDKRLTFAYGRALVTSRLVSYGAAIVLIAVLLVLASYISAVLASLFLLFLVGLYVLFAVSPMFTAHWLTRSRIILRQGWYFRTVLPLAEVVSVESVDELRPGSTPLGIHRPLGQSTLYVTGGRTGLVIARLAAPRRFWQAFGLRADEIVFDVADRNGFLAAVEERRRLLPPVQAERADA